MNRIAQESFASSIETGSGLHLEPEDVVVLACLMHELRDLTQSRRTFAATTRFLQRIANENETVPSVVDTLVRESA